MEIIPGVGLPVAQVGWTLERVEEAAGAPSSVRDEPHTAYWQEHEPAFSAHLDASGKVELVEVFHGGGQGEEATLRGVQLTHRVMDDVVADLAAIGMTGEPVDVGVEYQEGFSLVSMSSLTPADLDPDGAGDVDEDDERLVVEGVGIAPITYWRG